MPLRLPRRPAIVLATANLLAAAVASGDAVVSAQRLGTADLAQPHLDQVPNTIR